MQVLLDTLELLFQLIPQPIWFVLAAVGVYQILRFATSFLKLLVPVSGSLSVKAGSWAVVTGASEGIGKEFALQLAKKQFNVVIIARRPEVLDQVAAEIKEFGVEVICYPFDFSDTDDSKYRQLKNMLDKLDIGVLVNNVGIAHKLPTPFLEEDEKYLEKMVQVNMISMMRMTRIVAQQMVARKAGHIINIGSYMGNFVAPLYSVYSATKSFVRQWSMALSFELKPTGVKVEYINTLYVSTAMSKMRPTLFCPSPSAYVKAVLKKAGRSDYSTPYLPHAILAWFLDLLHFKTKVVYQQLLKIRQKGLKNK